MSQLLQQTLVRPGHSAAPVIRSSAAGGTHFRGWWWGWWILGWTWAKGTRLHETEGGHWAGRTVHLQLLTATTAESLRLDDRLWHDFAEVSH